MYENSVLIIFILILNLFLFSPGLKLEGGGRGAGGESKSHLLYRERGLQVT